MVDSKDICTYQSGKQLTFAKMQGCGNHFIVAATTEQYAKTFPPHAIRKLSDPHFGIGADGVLFIHSGSTGAAGIDFCVSMFNPDGSRMGMCGNGIRCVALFVDTYLDKAKKLKNKGLCFLVDDTTEIKCRQQPDGSVQVEMGNGQVQSHGSLVIKENLHFDYDIVTVPNPHAIILQETLPSIEQLCEWGAHIEVHSNFPNRTNVEFVKVHSKDFIEVLIWERGAGMTQSCGTGACATVLALYKRGLVSNACEAQLLGGKLFVEVRTENAVDYLSLTGPQKEVFIGQISIE